MGALSGLPAPPVVEWSVATLPLEGQRESGDLEVVAQFAGGALAAVIDGLGHGAEAALAARVAAATLRADPTRSPAAHVRACHETLHGTRGAVISVAAIDARAGRLSWCGVGNVEGWLVKPRARHEAILLRGGVVGHALPALHETTHALAPGDLVVLASDGIDPRFVQALVSGESVAWLAQEILLHFGRPTDDALVLVLRYLGAAL
jgi:negative regulator of sigma-B (phosphoserine phosphatase)